MTVELDVKFCSSRRGEYGKTKGHDTNTHRDVEEGLGRELENGGTSHKISRWWSWWCGRKLRRRLPGSGLVSDPWNLLDQYWIGNVIHGTLGHFLEDLHPGPLILHLKPYKQH